MNNMDDLFKKRLSANGFNYKSSLERIIEKYSKLQYQDGGVEVDLDSTTLQTLERYMRQSKAEISKLESKSLTDVREEPMRDVSSATAPDVTRDSQLDFTHEDGGHDETGVSSTTQCVSSTAQCVSSTAQCVSSTALSVEHDGSCRINSTVSSSEESLRNVSAPAVQPEDRDQDLELSLRSHGSSLLELYPDAIGRIGQAWRRRHVSEAAGSVLRRYRRWRRRTGRSGLGNNTFVVALRCAGRNLKNDTEEEEEEEEETIISPVKRQFTRAEIDPRSPLRTLNHVQQQQSPFRTLNHVQQQESPFRTLNHVQQQESPFRTLNHVQQQQSPFRTLNHVQQEQSPFRTLNHVQQEQSPLRTLNHVQQQQSPFRTLNHVQQQERSPFRTLNHVQQQERSPLKTLNHVQQQQSPFRTLNHVQQQESPLRTRWDQPQHPPVLVMDLSGPSETLVPIESSLNETFTVSDASRLGHRPSPCAGSPSRPRLLAADPSFLSRRLSLTRSLQADLHPAYASETAEERPDVYGSPVRKRRMMMMMKMETSLSRSPHGVPRSPTTYSGERFSREPSMPRLTSTPPHKPAVPLRMLHPPDGHPSLRPQLRSPQSPAAASGLRRHLSFDSSLPSIRVSDSPKKLDEDFLKLYHKFVCQSKSSFFNRHPCRLCARSSEASRGPSSSSFSSSSSSSSYLAALALSPHRSLLRKRHRELDRDGHPLSKRYRDERCPSSPGSQRHGKEMLRRLLAPAECGLSYGAGQPAVFQRSSPQRRGHVSAADCSGTGSSLDSRRFSSSKW